MCGIAGIIRNPSSTGYNEDKVARTFRHLVALSQSRGSDSTGIVIVNDKMDENKWSQGRNQRIVRPRKVIMYKEHVPAEEFIRSDGYESAMKRFDENTRALFGHTRAATSGTPLDNRNNHPHLCGNVIGIHNGVIYGHEQLAKQEGLKLQSDCDSEVIFALINKFIEDGMPLEKAIYEASKRLRGSYACAIAITNQEGKYALFRHGAPLYIRLRSYGNVLMFASEVGIIHQAYRAAKWEAGHTPFFVEMHEYVLPNDYAVVIDTNKSTTDWVQKAAPFELHK